MKTLTLKEAQTLSAVLDESQAAQPAPGSDPLSLSHANLCLV